METIMTKGTVRLRVPELLKEREMTVAEFARVTGLTYNTANSLARGYYDRIGMSTIAAICDGLGVEPGELFVYDPNEEPG